MREHKFRIWLLLIVFVTLISFPVINSLTGLVKDSENLEKRRMALRPDFDVNLLDPFPAKFETFYNDNFNLRSLMIKYYNLFKLKFFKQSPVPEMVFLGYNGWLFMDRYTYLGTNRLTIKELEEFRLELEYRKNFLESRGCKFYFAMAPAKTIIYGDQVPHTFYRYTSQSWADQLNDYLNERSTVKTLNLTDTLLRHRSEERPLYYKLDTHWNSLGGFFASNAFCNLVAKDFPSVAPLLLNDYKIKESDKRDGNCVQIIGFSDMFTDTEIELIPKKEKRSARVENKDYPFLQNYQPILTQTWKNNHNSNPKIIISGDSFSNWFLPHVSECFGTTLYVFDHWRYIFNEELIIEEKPDVYLLIVHEPLIREMLKYQARLGQYGVKK